MAAVKRGYSPNDDKEFENKSIEQLQVAGQDLYYLLNRGYPIKGASTFIGNRFMFSERQRLALARAISSEESIRVRKEKEIVDPPKNLSLNIDGFNTIITLEVALSNSLLLKCMDGTVRDLAALRGTYRIIDKTIAAINLIGNMLETSQIEKRALKKWLLKFKARGFKEKQRQKIIYTDFLSLFCPQSNGIFLFIHPLA